MYLTSTANGFTPYVRQDWTSHSNSYELPAGQVFKRENVKLTVLEACDWAMNAFKNTKRNQSSVKWHLMSLELPDYIVTQLEGDGCVMIDESDLGAAKDGGTASLHLDLEVAQNAYPILYFFRYLLGGDIRSASAAHGNQQATRAWRLSGYPALDLIRNLAPRATSKRNQYALAATYPLAINLSTPKKNLKPCAIYDKKRRIITKYRSQRAAGVYTPPGGEAFGASVRNILRKTGKITPQKGDFE